MTLAEIIIDYRKNHGYSQRQFAEICDISNSFISLLESGYNPNTGKPFTPSLISLRKIATGMGITIDELLTSADDLEVDISAEVVSQHQQPTDEALKFALFGENETITDAQFEEVKQFAKFVKERDKR